MSSPPAGGPESSPGPHWYPDPSIPGYIRYWNGTAWVPGSSRPEPGAGEPLPIPPPGATSALAAPQPWTAPPPVPQADETGPLFFDEEPPGPVPPAGPAAWPAAPGQDAGLPAAPGRSPAGSAAPAASDEDVGTSPAHPAGPAVAGTPDPRRPLGRQPAHGGGPAPALPPAGRSAPPDRPAPPAPAGPVGRPEPWEQTVGVGSAGPSAGEPWGQRVHDLARGPSPAAPARPAPLRTPPPPSPAGERMPAPRGSVPGAPRTDPLTAAGPRTAVPWESDGQAYPLGPGRRLLARLIDSLPPLGGAAAVALVVMEPAREHLRQKVDAIEQAGVTERIWLLDGTTGACLAAVLGAFFVLGLLLEALPTALWGTTAGKALCGARVLDLESQRKPSPGAALGRWLVCSVLSVLLIGLPGAAWRLRDRPWRQCWHDRAAGTFVARATRRA